MVEQVGDQEPEGEESGVAEVVGVVREGEWLDWGKKTDICFWPGREDVLEASHTNIQHVQSVEGAQTESQHVQCCQHQP